MNLARIGTFLKAIYAGVGAALTGIGAALVGANSFSGVSDAQWISIAVLALGAFGAVYGVTNSPAVKTTSTPPS